MSLENLTLGNEIRAARERAGYTVAKIAEITRIRAAVISDIEADDFSTCGGNAYARGHIRTLAKVIKLDGDSLIAKFAQVTGDFDRPMIDLLEENNVIKPRAVRPQISYKNLASVAAGVVAQLSHSSLVTRPHLGLRQAKVQALQQQIKTRRLSLQRHPVFHSLLQAFLENLGWESKMRVAPKYLVGRLRPESRSHLVMTNFFKSQSEMPQPYRSM